MVEILETSGGANPVPEGEQTLPTSGGANPAAIANANETTTAPETQTANTNIAEEWKDNPKYFQEGKKAGTLKPRYRPVTGIGSKPREVAGGGGISAPVTDATKFKGLNTGDLTKTIAGATSEAAIPKKDKAAKKLISSTATAKLYLKFLDVIIDFVSAGTYGNNFSKEESQKRSATREELEGECIAYLQTLDIDMPPWMAAVMGSALYVAPAFATVKGQEKAASLKSKIVGWTVGRLFK